jgi:FixJ family two-component response regulator
MIWIKVNTSDRGRGCFEMPDVSADRSRMQDDNLVLVVDDNPGMLKALQRMLRQHAYEPIVFSSAQDFKDHPDIDRAACVILDINLPDGSGIELREDLKAAGVSVPVIFITGNMNPKVREVALASGCLAFLTKPFSAHELIEPLRGASAG